MRRRRAWAAAVVVVTSALALALATAELTLRLFYPQPVGVWHQDPDGLAMHWPGLETYLPQFGVSVSFNSTGMRGGEHRLEKSAGVFRILLLGDSFMEALQVPYDVAFASLLERNLAEISGRPIEVVNASVSGWGTDDELLYLVRHGVKWKPDLVVVAMTLHNDVSDNLRERFHAVGDGALVERPRTPSTALTYKLIQARDYLAIKSHSYQLVMRARRAHERQDEAGRLSAHVVGLFRVPPEPIMTRGVELTGLLLERMARVASEHGSRMALVLIPLAVQLSDDRFAELNATGAGAGERFDRERPQRLMSDIGRRVGIDVIDLLPDFTDWTTSGRGSLHLERDGHWNVAGHRLAAGIVAQTLVRLARLRT
jgi:SGNH hydrolase-like domain, acetyltransferase AlgX